MNGRQLVLYCMVVLLFAGCRKGEEDPFFSVATRTARLKGSWKLESARVSGVYSNPGGNASDFYFNSDGSRFTIQFEGDSASQPISGPFRFLISFGKSGEMTITEEVGGNLFNIAGNWDFVNKGEGFSHRERIIISAEKLGSGSTGYFHPFFAVPMQTVYSIRGLHKKKLILTFSGYRYLQHAGESLKMESEFIFGR